MPTLEDLLREGVERRTPPDDGELFQRLVDRRRGRVLRRRIQAGLLAIIVLASSVGGFALLTHVFRTQPQRIPQPQAPVPTNGPIVFSRGVDGSIHLFAVEPGSGKKRQLTPQGEASYVEASVSPDGTQVLVVHRIPDFDGLKSVLATVPVEGGSPTWLTDPGVYHDPAWSPDGAKIAFVGGVADGLFVMNADGSAPRLILEQGITEVRYPTWSPDGVRLAFAATTPVDAARDIYSVALDGSGLMNLTSTRGTGETQPAWSWSTDRLAFVREGALMTAASDGSDIQQIFADDIAAMSPSWSPDGRLITFETELALADFDAPGPKIWTIGADGSKLTRLTPTGGFAPAWAPTIVDEPPSPADGVGRDIGLGFLVCNLEWLGGIDFLGDGTTGRAWTATKVKPNGNCPSNYDDRYGVAVDFTGDGLADSWSQTIKYCVDCQPWKAADLNGDGADELIVILAGGSQFEYGLYTVRNVEGEQQVVPYLTGEPGHSDAGHVAGEPFTFWVGSDESAYWFYCDALPVFWLTYIYSPVTAGQPDATAYETQVSIGTDGVAHILEARTFTVPYGTKVDLQYATSEPDCGLGVDVWR